MILDSQQTLEQVRSRAHPECMACAPDRTECGLALSFQCCSDGTVQARFDCPARFQGYPGVLHGGVVSTVLDAAMTHCLFAREIEAYTAELTVRFRHPVRIDEPLEVSAHVSRDNAPLYELQAEIRQDGQLRATGRGKFLQKPTETHP